MNTPAHLILGLTAFGKPGRAGVNGAALAGAFAPDLSLYAMTAVSILVLDISPQRVFGQLYYSDAWQQVFAIDNSFILWGIAFVLALWAGWARSVAFAGAGLLHLAFDFPLHTHDGRQHFWPLSDWVFESPVSYWDNAAHAGTVGPVVAFGATIMTFWIWKRFESLWLKLFVTLLLMAELASSGIWRLVF